MSFGERIVFAEVEKEPWKGAVINIASAPNVKIIDSRCPTVQVAHHMALGLAHRDIREAFEGVAAVEQVKKNGYIVTYFRPVTIEGDLPLRELEDFLESQGIRLKQK
ncbi:MAG: hypothetical protein Q8P71_01470 [bacterium]|nr:hypothetical protein [bacterium]